MQEISQDLARLCFLFHEKNELQSARHSARHALRRLNSIATYVRLQKQHKELSKFIDFNTHPDKVRLDKICDIANHISSFAARSPITATAYVSSEEAIMQDVANKREEFAQVEGRLQSFKRNALRKVPAKYENMKSSELKLMLLEQRAKHAQATLGIAIFTKNHRKEIASILKRNSWGARADAYNAWYVSIREINGKELVTSREGIAQLAYTQILENAIVKENT